MTTSTQTVKEVIVSKAIARFYGDDNWGSCFYPEHHLGACIFQELKIHALTEGVITPESMDYMFSWKTGAGVVYGCRVLGGISFNQDVWKGHLWGEMLEAALGLSGDMRNTLFDRSCTRGAAIALTEYLRETL